MVLATVAAPCLCIVTGTVFELLLPVVAILLVVVLRGGVGASDRRAVYSHVCQLAALSVLSRDCAHISGVHMSVCCFFVM